ncbi:Down syndrome cell adhesion molecule-like protein 1 [Fundulus heteroclitus]|uniref:Down syndrome cell adhesion molecule-like protein 1 n=1 Tax=Fundulus heteroclitus TaxID=8078 RepID=UPI00165B8ADB|nr:Down syndrome cell adhesion molecule-like protein 1 [Fundulus heteroclitus]
MNHLGSRYSALYCFLHLCLLRGCASLYVTAKVGTAVSLPCTYAAWKYGRLPFCWARESTSAFGCNNQVIQSDGTNVLSRLSWRYSLAGNLATGDASLRISQVQESDSGKYICRVEIPGWFNDQKTENTLYVFPGEPSQPQVYLRELKQRAVTVSWSPPFNGGRVITAYLIDIKSRDASWNTAVRSQVVQTVATLVDLRPAATYELRLFAVNSVGTSAASNVLTVTTHEAAPEGPPINVKLQALSSDSIKVTWKPPSVELRNGVLRSYIVSYREYDPETRQFQNWQQLSVIATSEEESAVLTNLKPSTQYNVHVQAKTNAGLGPVSTALFCTTLDEVKETTAATTLLSTAAASTKLMQYTSLTTLPPDPPVIVLKEVTDNTISLSWTPGFEGDSPITGFYLEYKAANASWDYTKTVIEFSSNETEATIIEMYPSTYNIRMFATNSVGTSKPSNVLNITIEETGQQNSSSTMSTITEVSMFAENRGGVYTTGIIVLVVLVVLIGAIVTGWQLRRCSVYDKGSKPLQEL